MLLLMDGSFASLFNANPVVDTIESLLVVGIFCKAIP